LRDTTLAPQTAYEVHYKSDGQPVSGYVLFAVGSSPGQGFANASAPADGDWSKAGNFLFVDIPATEGEALPATGFPDGYFRYQMATDSFTSMGEGGAPVGAGSKGHLCNIITQEPGELELHLYLSWLDLPGRLLVEMEAQAAFVVEDDGSDE